MTDVIHVITPGDHFSPRTGSAIPTVVHGLADATSKSGDPMRHSVVVEAATMRPRYESAVAIEYTGARAPTRRERYLDLVRIRLGRPRQAVARYYEPIASAVRQQRPSILLAHNAPVLPWLLRDTPHRVVLYAHNELLRTYTKLEAGRTLAGVAAIVCVSESLAERTRAALPERLSARVHVVGNGVDTTQFAPEASTGREVAASDGPLCVMFVGRTIRAKGADVLLRAAAILGRDALEVVIVGSQGFDRNAALSPYERELRVLAEANAAQVTFEPFVDRATLPALLRTADVLVVPSRWAEPSGLTASEGLATGLPVIASRVGGIPEVVGPAGRYVEPDDPAALAAALADLADDAGLRHRMGLQAREWALAHDWGWAWSNLRGVLQSL